MNRFQIIRLLSESNAAVEAGICRIYANQTQDEQTVGATRHSNGVGFNANDAHYGSYLAQWVQGGKHLTGRHLEAARKMCRHYVGQLERHSQEQLARNTRHFGGSYTLTDIDPFQHRGGEETQMKWTRELCALRPEWREEYPTCQESGSIEGVTPTMKSA